jgi:histidine triad (HIT) family protein
MMRHPQTPSSQNLAAIIFYVSINASDILKGEHMAENSCIFCRIAAEDAPSNIIYKDELAVAFADIDPKAPSHILIVPREHMDSLNDAARGDEPLLGHLLRLASKIANQIGIAETGFRTVVNTGDDGGQSVQHLHLHLLGGRKMTWPPG